MIWTPRVTVAAVIEQNKRYLLVEEFVDNKCVFNQPAGHLEDGESLQQAIIREVLEETIYPFTPTALCGIYRWRLSKKERTYLRFCFCGSVDNPAPNRELDKEIVDTHWLTGSEIRAKSSELRSPMVLQCIEDYEAGQRIPLSILHDIN